MQREKRISTEAMVVLSECTVNGNTVVIPGGLSNPLPPSLYREVNTVLQGIGGKWNKKSKSHVFQEPESEIAEMLEGCIQTGLAVPLSRNGYFPTPLAIGNIVAEFLEPMGRILEPSAGTGMLIQALMHFELEHVDAIENDPKLYKQLCDKLSQFPWFHSFPVNFLEWTPGSVYDRIAMNPPFATKGAPLADIDHIMHAWELLKPAGRLVSIASASLTFRRENKAIKFREHVAIHGRIEELPEKSFRESGTLTRTVIVVLDKPTTPAA